MTPIARNLLASGTVVGTASVMGGVATYLGGAKIGACLAIGALGIGYAALTALCATILSSPPVDYPHGPLL